MAAGLRDPRPELDSRQIAGIILPIQASTWDCRWAVRPQTDSVKFFSVHDGGLSNHEKSLGLLLICVSLFGFAAGCSPKTQTKTQEAGQAVKEVGASAAEDVKEAAGDAVTRPLSGTLTRPRPRRTRSRKTRTRQGSRGRYGGSRRRCGDGSRRCRAGRGAASRPPPDELPGSSRIEVRQNWPGLIRKHCGPGPTVSFAAQAVEALDALCQFRQQRFFSVADALAAKPEERAFAGCVGDRVGDCHDPGLVVGRLGHAFLSASSFRAAPSRSTAACRSFSGAASPADNGTMSRTADWPAVISSGVDNSCSNSLAAFWPA